MSSWLVLLPGQARQADSAPACLQEYGVRSRLVALPGHCRAW